jgi:hypothetical protein
MPALHNPAKNSMQLLTATFAELTPSSGKFVGKEVFPSGQISSYPEKIALWNWKAVTVANIDDLERYLQDAQHRNLCLVRGVPNDGAPATILRRKDADPDPKKRRRQPGFTDDAQAWAVFDLDGVELAFGYDWISDPQGAVHSIIADLPDPWPRVSYVACFTGTHGLIKDDRGWWTGEFNRYKVRCRIFVMLDRAITCEELKAWSISLKPALPAIDPALANSVVQLIYMTRPRWSGKPGVDVLAETGVPTCWLHQGEVDVMTPPAKLKEEASYLKAEGDFGVAANHPDSDAAIRAIGKPTKNGGDIYAHILSAIGHLTRGEEVELGNIAVAVKRVIAAIEIRIEHFKDEITANLQRSGRPWGEVWKYVRDPGKAAHYARWCLEHPRPSNGRSKTVTRVRVARDDSGTKVEVDALAERRKQLRGTVSAFVGRAEAFLDGVDSIPPVWLITEQTGIGKSYEIHTAAADLVTRGRGPVVIAVPRLDLADEQLQALERNFPHMKGRVRVWRGYTADDPDQPGMKMCHRPDDIEAVLKSGLRGDSLCRHRKRKVECPLFHSCGAQIQRGDRADVWFVAHESLTHQRPKAIKKPSVLFIDEDFIDAFLIGEDGKFTLALDALSQTPTTIKDDLSTGDFMSARGAIFRILKKLPADKQEQSHVARADLEHVFSVNRCEALVKLEWMEKAVIDIYPRWNSERLMSELERVAGNAVVARRAALWKMVGRSIEVGAPEVSGRIGVKRDSKGARQVIIQGTLRVHKSWNRKGDKKGNSLPVLITDATGDISMIRQLWPQAQHVGSTQPLPMPHVRIRQVVNKSFAMMTCRPVSPHEYNVSPNEEGDSGRQAHGARELYAAVIAQGLKYNGKPVGLITYKNTELWIRENCVVPPWLSIAHFGAVTGFNAFQTVRLLVIAGRPLPNPRDAAHNAEATFGEAVPVGGSGRYEYVDVEDVIATVKDAAGRNGARVKQKRALHPNMERVRFQITEGGLIQAIGRGRGILRTAENPLDILLLTDTPVPGIGPVEPVMWENIRPTPDQVMLAVHGRAMGNPIDAAIIGSDIITSADALSKLRRRRISTEESDNSILESVIRKCPTHPPPLHTRIPEADPANPLDIVVYQREGEGRKAYMGVSLTGVGQPSSAWWIENLAPLGGFGRSMLYAIWGNLRKPAPPEMIRKYIPSNRPLPIPLRRRAVPALGAPVIEIV